MGEILVGGTGFVGGNLLAKHRFDRAVHGTDVHTAFGTDCELVVYAGVPAAMFLANRDPEADLEVMRTARQNLRRIRAKQTVLISTIAVYPDSRGKTEADRPDPAGLSAYGRNRLQLENWVREDFPDALIIRLPALYGLGLKKNFLYDLHTLTPAMLRPEKYRELAAKSPEVGRGYTLGANGFYTLNGGVEPSALRAFFAGNDWNALAFTDSRSRYQFYPLGRLWADICTARSAGLTLLNLTTPPVSAGEVYRAVTGGSWANELPGTPFDYDLHSLHAEALGGADGQLCTKQAELDDICRFMEDWT